MQLVDNIANRCQSFDGRPVFGAFRLPIVSSDIGDGCSKFIKYSMVIANLQFSIRSSFPIRGSLLRGVPSLAFLNRPAPFIDGSWGRRDLLPTWRDLKTKMDVAATWWRLHPTLMPKLVTQSISTLMPNSINLTCFSSMKRRSVWAEMIGALVRGTRDCKVGGRSEP
jgi:hypothetical protein